MVEEKGKEKEQVDEISGVNTVDLTQITEGGSEFMSQGYSNIKATKKGKIENVRIPIKSTGVTELIEEFKRNEPSPPAKAVLVKKDSEEGKGMKLSEDKWVKMPDFTDAKYIEKREKFEGDLGIAILAKGVDIPFVNKKGEEVTDPDEKVSILKSKGLSSDQFTQIVNDIRSLTLWTEKELADFFGLSSV